MVKPVILVILDGFGIASPSRGNAITLAKMPNFNSFIQEYPAVTLQAAGEMVGLPWQEMGNSEVGHLSLGSGKIIYQSLPLINKAIINGSFFRHEQFLKASEHVKKNHSRLHLLGLCSEGGVHGSINHLYALLEFARQQNLKEVFVHAILDGRDTPHNAALKYISDLNDRLKQLGTGKIATISGRFWAMDRDNHWERVARVYQVMTEKQGLKQDPVEVIENSYRRGIFDEEFVPVAVDEGMIQANDAVIFFNWRADRARELTKAFVLPSFTKFPRQYIKNLFFVTMMEYEKNLPVHIAFQSEKVEKPLAKIISEAGLKQLHLAETEKYAHVTFFFNGGQEETFPGEDRLIIPSPQVTSYAEKPAMSAQQITQTLIEKLQENIYHFIVVNFANADMVGHTGNLKATIQAVEAVDQCLGLITPAVLQYQGTLIITADHGNAEEIFDLQTGEIDKEHSTNPVPFILLGEKWKMEKSLWPVVPHNDLSVVRPVGILADVAPTILEILNLPVPPEMTGRSLLRR